MRLASIGRCQDKPVGVHQVNCFEFGFFCNYVQLVIYVRPDCGRSKLLRVIWVPRQNKGQMLMLTQRFVQGAQVENHPVGCSLCFKLLKIPLGTKESNNRRKQYSDDQYTKNALTHPVRCAFAIYVRSHRSLLVTDSVQETPSM